MTTPEELQAQADAIAWFHSIDLGQGVRTYGLSELALPPEQLPDFTGRSVLDIGAWDGYYSYLAERHGASRVVALDHYAWGVDIPARSATGRSARPGASCPTTPRTSPTSGTPTYRAGGASSSPIRCSTARSSRWSPTSP